MIQSIVYFILALLGIGFLIFIHELGHYFVALKQGIRVEEFAIGFGKPIIQWERNGVKWKFCWLLFGGYVKMAGMEKKGSTEPYKIKDGFFGVSPWSRIQVAAAGPLVNILFTIIAFSFLFVLGGREKSFSEYTKHIGYVEPDTSLYEAEIRAGDEITKLNGRPFKGFSDLIYGAALDNSALTMMGYKINYLADTKTPYTYTFPLSKEGDGMQRAISATSSLKPAEYLSYEKMPSGALNPLIPDSPMEGSGIAYGDRIVWVDGELIFSQRQLSKLINSKTVLLTVEREGETFLTRVPKLSIGDLRLTKSEKEELDDWRYEAKLSEKVDQLAFIPYNLTATGIVEGPLGYIDEKSQSKLFFESQERTPGEIALREKDKIVAIQGQKITSSYQLLQELQTKKSLIIVEKMKQEKPPLWTKADNNFVSSFDIRQLKTITHSIGTDSLVDKTENLQLLKPVTPVAMREFPLDEVSDKARQEKIEKYQKEIEEISDTEKQKSALATFQRYQNRLMLGITLQDKTVAYNPSPFVLFGDVVTEIYRTLFALVTGYLSPKHLSGPVGIVQVIHHGWSVGVKEAVFWLGMISLNLGLINLLPIPVLDGGHIVFSIWEAITKKPLKAKTRERLILPFVILIIGLFIYFTYNDLARLFTQFF